MPGLTGLDLQDRLIAQGHRIPIIFITGRSDDTARARAMKAGAVAFLSKPINSGKLLSYLDEALKVPPISKGQSVAAAIRNVRLAPVFADPFEDEPTLSPKAKIAKRWSEG
jgi:FixJ family two-component response regulator